jgi:hypothetical protein
MAIRLLNRNFLIFGFFVVSTTSFAQSVPMGISYQAVARDNFGKEIINKAIDVRFSIISGNPLGTVVYQELQSTTTSKYGVFSLTIGKGDPTGGTYGELSQVQWGAAPHYLRVEVKFDNDFLDMGTMQFLAVPYALYAQKSLEPGPQGPKGDPGDPATDNQTLSFNGANLSISGGNTVNLSSLNVPHQLTLIGDTLSILGGNKVALTNQIQDLQLDVNNKLKITKNPSATEIDLNSFKQSLSYNTSTAALSISGGTGADLSDLKTAGIQDIHLSGNQLTIDKNPSSAGVDLSKYMDNTDNQQLTYSESNKTLSISGGNTVVLGNSISFRAKKVTPETGLSAIDYDFILPLIEYNDGSGYNGVTGVFTAPVAGIYTFIIGFTASSIDNMKALKLLLNGIVYETLISDIVSRSSQTRSITLKLAEGDNVKAIINPGLSTESGTGSFSGYRVY